MKPVLSSEAVEADRFSLLSELPQEISSRGPIQLLREMPILNPELGALDVTRAIPLPIVFEPFDRSSCGRVPRRGLFTRP